MTEETEEAVVRAKIVAEFTQRWSPEEAEQRVKLLEEAIPLLYDYAKLNNQRVDIKVHPEHLEHYVAYLRPRVRGVLEHCGVKVIESIKSSLSPDERLAKIVKCVNIMDARAAAASDEASNS